MELFTIKKVANIQATGQITRWKVMALFTTPMEELRTRASGAVTPYMGRECCIIKGLFRLNTNTIIPALVSVRATNVGFIMMVGFKETKKADLDKFC